MTNDIKSKIRLVRENKRLIMAVLRNPLEFAALNAIESNDIDGNVKKQAIIEIDEEKWRPLIIKD